MPASHMRPFCLSLVLVTSVTACQDAPSRAREQPSGGDDALEPHGRSASSTVSRDLVAASLLPPTPARPAAQANDYSADDSGDRPVLTVTNAAANGPGSFPDAVMKANNLQSGAVIAFNLPGSGVLRIPISSSIPVLTPTTIDGCTQPGADCAHWPPLLLIELDFQATALEGGLLLSDHAEVRGLSLTGMKLTDGIQGAIVMKGTEARVQGNYIGVRPDGLTPDGNLYGVVLNGVSNMVGSDLDGLGDDLERNLISGNTVGIFVGQETGATRISGNYLGTDASGTVAVANGTALEASSYHTSLLIASNLISGNEQGITLKDGLGAADVVGNYFGTDRFGSSPLGNQKSALWIDGSTGVQVGGAGPQEGNLIAFNGSGILLEDGEGAPASARVSHNTMYSNEGLGIDLNADGVTRNDPGDADAGPSLAQNYPEIVSSLLVNGMATVVYRVPSDPANSAYPLTVEFYRADADGDEGAVWLATDTYDESQAGALRTVSFSPAAGLNDLDRIIATATDQNGNTSEFTPPDQDGDGYPYTNDCNDADSEIHPGQVEACDDLDSNCDGSLVDSFTDTDGDGQPDCVDPDDDGDSVEDSSDNCPLIDNSSQADLDQDGEGDACDNDVDGDLVNAAQDCDDHDPTVSDLVSYYPDTDGDGFGVPGGGVELCASVPPPGYAANATDNCPDVANPDQIDVDLDGVGDACQAVNPTTHDSPTPIPSPEPTGSPDDAGGCSCAQSGGSSPLPLSLAWLAVMAWPFRRRRGERPAE